MVLLRVRAVFKLPQQQPPMLLAPMKDLLHGK
jgi:hypothetical protein